MSVVEHALARFLFKHATVAAAVAQGGAGPRGAGKRDYYDVLGVNKDSDPDAIKKAYRKLAIQLHPDRNKAADAEEKFKELSEAYAVLSDPEKKARYDQYGHAGIDQQYSSDDLYRNINVDDLFGGTGLDDLFAQMFGFGGGRGGARGGRPGGPQRGRDLQVGHRITLEDAFAGTETRIEYWRLEACDHCKGKGAEPGTKVARCDTCGGQGRVQQMVRTPFGTMAQVSGCPTCGGEGQRIETPCTRCKGSGHERHRRSVTVTIPAGIESGQSLRVTGQGEVGRRGGPYGDLYVQVEIEEGRFQREGLELAAELHITIPQAVLGADMPFETIDGRITVTVPAGTESGTVLRVRGKGMPELRGGGRRGDLHLRVRIDVPERLSPRARELLEELATELGTDVKPKKKRGFFG